MADDYGTLSPYSDLYQPSYGDLARNRAGPADRPGYSHLGSALGGMFFGGGAREARGRDIFNEAATKEVTLQELVMKARKEREESLARDSMAARHQSDDPDYSDFVHMGKMDPAAARQMQERSEMAKMLADPTIPMDEIYRRQYILGLHPSARTDIQEGSYLDPSLGPDKQGERRTPGAIQTEKTSKSAEDENRAQAASAEATRAFTAGPHTRETEAATKQHEQATRTGEAEEQLHRQTYEEKWNEDLYNAPGAVTSSYPSEGGPVERHGKGAGGDKQPQQLTGEELKYNFGDVDTDPRARGEYQAFQRFAAMRGITDPREALAEYRKLVYEPQSKKKPAAGAPNDISARAPVSQQKPGPSMLSDLGKAVMPPGGGDLDTAITPKSQAEFDALPKGQLIINPKDGQPMRKR